MIVRSGDELKALLAVGNQQHLLGHDGFDIDDAEHDRALVDVLSQCKHEGLTAEQMHARAIYRVIGLKRKSIQVGDPRGEKVTVVGHGLLEVPSHVEVSAPLLADYEAQVSADSPWMLEDQRKLEAAKRTVLHEKEFYTERPASAPLTAEEQQKDAHLSSWLARHALASVAEERTARTSAIEDGIAKIQESLLPAHRFERAAKELGEALLVQEGSSQNLARRVASGIDRFNAYCQLLTTWRISDLDVARERYEAVQTRITQSAQSALDAEVATRRKLNWILGLVIGFGILEVALVIVALVHRS